MARRPLVGHNKPQRSDIAAVLGEVTVGGRRRRMAHVYSRVRCAGGRAVGHVEYDNDKDETRFRRVDERSEIHRQRWWIALRSST
jgi:hypothetical protein